jgi:hypothetical protein
MGHPALRPGLILAGLKPCPYEALWFFGLDPKSQKKRDNLRLFQGGAGT